MHLSIYVYTGNYIIALIITIDTIAEPPYSINVVRRATIGVFVQRLRLGPYTLYVKLKTNHGPADF